MKIFKSVMIGLVACAGLSACTGEGSVDRYGSQIAGLQDECDQILVDMADAESDASQDALEEAYRECLENHVANHGGDEQCDEDDARRCEEILDGIKDTLNDDDRAPTCGDHAETDVCSLMDAYRVCLMDDGDDPLHCERVRDEAAECREGGDDEPRTTDQALEEDRPEGDGEGDQTDGEGDRPDEGGDDRPDEGDDRPTDAEKCERIVDEFPECFGEDRPDDGDDRPDDERPDENPDDHPDENPDENPDGENPDEHPDNPDENPDGENPGPSAEQCEAIVQELLEVIEECSQDGPESAEICEAKIKAEAPECFD